MLFVRKNAGVVRSLLLFSVLGLAACGSSPATDDASRIDSSNFVPTTTQIISVAPTKDVHAEASMAGFATELTTEVNAMLAERGLEADLEVESYMVPDEMQVRITGARAYVAVLVTLRQASNGQTLIKAAPVTYVTPENGPIVADVNALVMAFSDHLGKSIRMQ